MFLRDTQRYHEVVAVNSGIARNLTRGPKGEIFTSVSITLTNLQIFDSKIPVAAWKTYYLYILFVYLEIIK